jgi:hypothetical protein
MAPPTRRKSPTSCMSGHPVSNHEGRPGVGNQMDWATFRVGKFGLMAL